MICSHCHPPSLPSPVSLLFCQLVSFLSQLVPIFFSFCKSVSSVWSVCNACTHKGLVVCTHVESSGRCPMSSSTVLYLICLRPSLSLNLQPAVLVRLADHWTLETVLSPLPDGEVTSMYSLCLCFHVAAGDLNSGPHAYKASKFIHWTISLAFCLLSF